MAKCIKAALLMLISVLWVGCDKDEPIDKVEIIKMYVSAETGTYTPWGSEVPVECMLVKEDGDLEYSHLAFGGIQGFDYVRGHEYELEVRKTTLANPPADGSNIAYVRISLRWYRCSGRMVPRGAEPWYRSYRSDGTGTKCPLYTLSKGALQIVLQGTLS